MQNFHPANQKKASDAQLDLCVNLKDSEISKKIKDSLKDTQGKNVLLIFPPWHKHVYGNEWKLSETTTAPLGLLYLATPLAKEGYDMNFIDLTVDKLEKEEYFNFLKNADYILISCYTQNLKSTRIILSDIKSVNKNAYIICGGPYCNQTENHVEGSDLTVFGEAEQMIVKILDIISLEKSLKGIPGLSYIKNGKILRNPGTLLVKNLDLSEPPSFDLAKNKNYGFLYGGKIEGMTAIMTSRGCPFRCSFCASNSTQYRKRSIDNVIKEIELREEEGAKYIIFYDDNFLLHRKRVLELMDKIIKHKINLKIAIQGRVDLADFALYKKLKKAGVSLFIFGIESANQDVLNFYNKKTTVEIIKRTLHLANKVGILTFGNFIIGAPMEKKKHFEVNKRFFKEVPLDFISIHILQYIYPSLLWKKMYKSGLIEENDIIVAANERLSNFSKKDLVKVQDELLRAFYNNPKRIVRIMYKSSRNFGVSFILRIIKIFFSKSIYRSAEKFHAFAVKNVQIEEKG